MKNILVTILFYLSCLSLCSQSTNPSNPTPLTFNNFTGAGPQKETTYYFSFNGGPGEVNVTFKIKATDYSTFARLELLTTGMQTLATHNMNATTGTGVVQITKNLSLKKAQTIIVKLILDANLSEYNLLLEGKADVTASPEIITESSSGQENQIPNTSSQQDNNSGTNGNAAKKFFSIDFSKYNPGQLIKLPKIGTLEIQLSDGSVQTIDLKTIKSISINKQQQ